MKILAPAVSGGKCRGVTKSERERKILRREMKTRKEKETVAFSFSELVPSAVLSPASSV